MRLEKEMIESFKRFADDHDQVRTLIMTSSRTRDAEIDFLSDYDIEIYVNDISLFESDDWLSYFGPVMVRWPYKPSLNDHWINRLVLFKDRVRVDFQISNLRDIDESRYINGYEVLVDKDDKANLNEATYDEFIIRKPDKESFEKLVNEFWWNVYYVPKYLWRDQLPFAKYMLEHILRFEYLHKLINWYIGYQNDWQEETGALGRYYKKLLSKEDWVDYEATFAGASMEDNYKALDNMTRLFRRMGLYLAEQLAYEYPEEVNLEVMTFVEYIKNKGR